MQRVSTILLAVLAVVVVVGAVLTIRDNGHVDDSRSPTTEPAVGTPARSTPAPTSTPAPSSATSSGASTSSTTSSGSPTARLTIAFVGDDWTSGQAATSDEDRSTTIVAKQLGVVEVNVGKAGAGYVAKADDGSGPYSGQVAGVVAAQPDVVVVSGGRNDDAYSIAAAGRAATTLFATLHTRLPHATLIAVAPLWGDSDLPPEMAQLGSDVKAAITAVGGRYVALADPIHGRPSLMADTADPDDAGYAAIAASLEPRLAPLLPS